MASVKLARLGFHLSGAPRIDYDREVTRLPDIDKEMLFWFWDLFKLGEVKLKEIPDNKKDDFLFLIQQGYICRKSPGLYTCSELGQIYHNKLTSRETRLRLGVPARDKPLLIKLSQYLERNWFTGLYSDGHNFLTDGCVVLKSGRLFDFSYIEVPDGFIQPAPKEIIDTVKAQISIFKQELKHAVTVEPYKFQREELLKPGKIWFKERNGNNVYALSEFYYDYLYGYSGKVIIDDTIKLIPYNGLNIFLFLSSRYTKVRTFGDNIVGYVVGLKVKAGAY